MKRRKTPRTLYARTQEDPPEHWWGELRSEYSMRTRWRLQLYQKDSYSMRCIRKAPQTESHTFRTGIRDSRHCRSQLMRFVLAHSLNTNNSDIGQLQMRSWLCTCQSNGHWIGNHSLLRINEIIIERFLVDVEGYLTNSKRRAGIVTGADRLGKT